MDDNEIGDKFSPEARAELLAMYTGMALQGLLAGGHTAYIGADAVRFADETVTALEKFQADRAKLEATDVGTAQ